MDQSNENVKTLEASSPIPTAIIITPPVSKESSDISEAPLSETVFLTKEAEVEKNCKSSPRISRFQALRESFRLMRPNWSKKSIGKRRRSKSVGDEAGDVATSDATESDTQIPVKSTLLTEPIKGKTSATHRHGRSFKVKVSRIFGSFRQKSKAKFKDEYLILPQDKVISKHVPRKRSQSLGAWEPLWKREVDITWTATRKRFQSESCLSLQSAFETKKEVPVCKSRERKRLLSANVEDNGICCRRRSLSLNDISLLENSSAEKHLLKAKKEHFFRRAFTISRSKSWKGKRASKKHRTSPVSSESDQLEKCDKPNTSGMGQNLTVAASTPDPISGGGSNYPREMGKVSAKKGRDEEVTRVREELLLARRQLYEKDQQLSKLHQEIHKLKSVLEQQHNSEATGSVRGSLVPAKKCGVSGESLAFSPSLTILKIEKDFRSRQLIKEALLDNSFLQNYLDPSQLRLIIDAMYEKEFEKGTLLCEQGAFGSHLYVIAYGHCQIMTDNEPINTIGPGKAFGELAILYNCARTATVKAITKVRVWVLDRKVFHSVMVKTGKNRRSEYRSFLRSVPLLQNLSDEQIAKIVDAIEIEVFRAGEYICRQGSPGDCFYIIASGSVKVTQETRKENKKELETRMVRSLGKGDYFGEQALLSELDSMRTANVISEDCECLVIDRENFLSLLGNLNEIKEKHYGNDVPLDENNEINESEDSICQQIELDDLEVLGTLGVGGFGRVDLVRCTWDTEKVFALKSCSKSFIRSTQQEQHINNERIVQKIASRHQFITKLYRTYKDANYLYFLMEVALGGELWTLLKNRGSFDENTTRFYLACVVEALQYLHSQHIVYRDLKPENCLLDAEGYLKLTDFGFSKILGPGEKTWTFCGTPEYVAPEIILNRGHDHAVDFWSIGILMYELLTGLPPFQSSDPLKTYNIILRGFDAIGFDENIFSKYAVNLIRRLCRENPSERIGVQKNGFNDIKRHKWFSGYDWNALIKRAIKPPIVPVLSGKTDLRYFDISSQDMSMRADFDLETTYSGEYNVDWDAEF